MQRVPFQEHEEGLVTSSQSRCVCAAQHVLNAVSIGRPVTALTRVPSAVTIVGIEFDASVAPEIGSVVVLPVVEPVVLPVALVYAKQFVEFIAHRPGWQTPLIGGYMLQGKSRH